MRPLGSGRRTLAVSVPGRRLRGTTLDFYLSDSRNATAAKQFFDRVLAAPNHLRVRVINADGNPSHPKAARRLMQEHCWAGARVDGQVLFINSTLGLKTV